LQAMQFIKEVGFMEVIFEGNAAQVVKEIKAEPPFLSWIGHFLESIHSEMSSFRSVSFSSIPCECNIATHTLANEASNNILDLCWLEETPRSVSSIVLREQHCP
jgi:hypothetical protein